MFSVMFVAGGVLLLFAPSDGGNDKKSGPDIATVAFDAYEAAWRKLSGERAAKLRAGEFATQKAGDTWFLKQNMTALETAFTPMLNSHYEQFGGENWTANKEAAVWEGYSR